MLQSASTCYTCYKVYQTATRCYTVLECFLWESATRVEKVVLLGRLSHSLNRKYDPWQGTYILLGNDGFRKIQNTAIGSCYQHHSCQRNLKGVFHQDLRAAGLMDQPTLFREKILLWIPQMQNKHCTNKTQCQPCKRLAWSLISHSSFLVLLSGLCIRPFSAWWQADGQPGDPSARLLLTSEKAVLCKKGNICTACFPIAVLLLCHIWIC